MDSAIGFEPDIAIAVMGRTGVGKSTFIQMITGNEDIVVGHSLTSGTYIDCSIWMPIKLKTETSEVHGYPYDDGHTRYMLIDTPGFDDTYVSDNVIISKIRTWLHASYQSGISLSGILYLHSITSPRLPGSAIRHLRLFRELVGDDNLGNVILATTFWNEIDPVLGERREAELAEKRTYWGQLVERGSSIMRLDLSRASAMNVLRAVAETSQVALDAHSNGGLEEADSPYIPLLPGVGPAADFDADLARAAQNHAYLRQQQQEQFQRWETALAQERERLRRRSEELERARLENERKRREKTAQRAKIYGSFRCRCTLVGKARCRSCRRIVTKVDTSFYRKCINRKCFPR
jgi:energy-coupling factor transporter ATP-binding protein EcfA2